MDNLLCSQRKVQLLPFNEILSPVPEILGTNSVPTSMQSKAIERCLIDVDTEVQRLETQIQQMQDSDAIVNLKAQQQKLMAFTKDHHALLSPARRIYPELLSEIFLFFAHSNIVQITLTGGYIGHCFDPNRGALLFTRICRLWRAVAIATPDLWAYISFDVKPRQQFNLMDMWLERSKASNLTIAVSGSGSADTAATAPCNQQALRLLISQAHRWESAVLSLPLIIQCWDLFSAAQGQPRQLKRLYGFLAPTQHQIPDMISDATRLTHLTLTNCQLSIAHSPIHGVGITHLCYCAHQDFPPISIDTLLQGLQSLPNLEYLEIFICVGFAPITGPSTQLVTLSKVLTFSMRIRAEKSNSRWDEMAELWQALRLPNLVKLSFHHDGPLSLALRPEWPHLPFLGFIAQSPKLRSLLLHSPSAAMEPGHFIDVFQRIPNLTTLEIALTWTKQSCRVLEHLAARSTLPKLSECTIRYHPLRLSLDYISEPFVHGFMQMAKSKMTNHTWFQSASLDDQLSSSL